MDQIANSRNLAAEIAALLPALARLANRDAVALRLADTAACALGAERLADQAQDADEGTITRIRRYGSWGQGPCTVWADGKRASLDDASLRNGVAARYLDYNDTYVGRAVIHPSDMIAALVALAEVRGIGDHANVFIGFILRANKMQIRETRRDEHGAQRHPVAAAARLTASTVGD